MESPLSQNQRDVMGLLEELGEVSFTKLCELQQWTPSVTGTIMASLINRGLVLSRWEADPSDAEYGGTTVYNEAN